MRPCCNSNCCWLRFRRRWFSKDASAFNIQWRGAGPLFIDIPSFLRLVPGEPWVGYRQFYQEFLYPLFLQAYTDLPFQPWLRGHIEGIEPEHCKHLMSVRDLLRPGVFVHVYLEFVAKDDPMVQTLLRNTEDLYAGYEVGYFEQCPSHVFDVAQQERLTSGRVGRPATVWFCLLCVRGRMCARGSWRTRNDL
jgi:hypothetical protein